MREFRCGRWPLVDAPDRYRYVLPRRFVRPHEHSDSVGGWGLGVAAFVRINVGLRRCLGSGVGFRVDERIHLRIRAECEAYALFSNVLGGEEFDFNSTR